ncbi:MAG: protein kinase [Blastocatellia bacterium]|nr:protein kinase [Blastocatellia bacterium]
MKLLIFPHRRGAESRKGVAETIREKLCAGSAVLCASAVRKSFASACLLLVAQIVFLLWFSLPGWALDPTRQLLQDVWQIEQGLPQNTINTLLQTRDGYLWFGTFEGVVRFDGVRFQVFDKQTVPEILNNGIWSLCEGKDGSLWAGTNGGGLIHFNQGRVETLTTAQGLPNNTVVAVYLDSRNDLWVGTNGGGLACYREGKFQTFRVKDGLADDSVTSICEDLSGTLWIGTNNRGVSTFKDGRFRTYTTADGLSHNSIRTLYRDTKGTVWIGTNGGGLTWFRDGTFGRFTTKDGLSNDFAFGIHEDRDGNLWIGTYGGGINWLRDGRLTSFTSKEGLSNDSVICIAEDHEGSIWLGTNGGLIRFKKGKFSGYSTSQGLTDNLTRTILEDSQGNVWIGTANGLNCLRDGKITGYTTKEGLPHNLVLSLCEDRAGDLWVGTGGGGICRFHNGTFQTFTDKNGLANNLVRAIYADRQGTLWIGTNGGGFSLYKDGVFTTYSTKDGLSNNIVKAFHEDRSGQMWIGTDSGLNCFRNGKFTVFHTTEGLSNDNVFTIYEDAEGCLWVGTSAGLNRIENGRFAVLTIRDGLFHDAIFHILEDDTGRFWLTCNKGVFSIPRQMCNDVVQHRVKSLTCTLYGPGDGLKSRQCSGNTQPAGWKSRDGRLWFPTVKGVSVFDPREGEDLNRKIPPVAIERLVVDGQPAEPQANISLPSGSDKIEIHYAGLSFLIPEKVQFRYWLEGYDKTWGGLTTRRSAYYTNLPPKTYRFHVKACNNDGIWNETGQILTFTIQPRFYQTGWFAALVAVSAVGAILSGLRFQAHRLRVQASLQEARLQTEAAEAKALAAEIQAQAIEAENRQRAEAEAAIKKKNEELAEALERTRRLQAETERQNRELIASQQQADRIFSALAEALPGTVLDGKYRLEEKIGSGGFGAVFRACHLVLNIPVAVKVFRPAPGNDSADAVERFRLEGISAARIKHPNAISVLDSGISTEGIAYLVMELLQGHSLSEELQHCYRLSLRRVVTITEAVCLALAEAHRLGIVHRDIKPANIFLNQTPEGETVKVVDFGIAKFLGEDTPSQRNLTATGGIIGTPTYMAPERLRNEPYDGRSDVYSLGVMVFEMLAGRTPFPAPEGDVIAIVLDHLNQIPPSVCDFAPEVPETVAAILARTLAKKPDERPTAREFAEQLEEAARPFMGAEPEPAFVKPSQPVDTSNLPTGIITPRTPSSTPAISTQSEVETAATVVISRPPITTSLKEEEKN